MSQGAACLPKNIILICIQQAFAKNIGQRKYNMHAMKTKLPDFLSFIVVILKSHVRTIQNQFHLT